MVHSENFERIMEKLAPICEKEQVIFVKFILDTVVGGGGAHVDEHKAHSAGAQFKKTKSHFPEATIVLDLTLSQEEILKQMKPKGRYNIKVAERNGVAVHEVHEKDLEKTLEKFYEIFQKTAERDGFRIHPLSYYQKMLTTLGPQHAKLFIATAPGEVPEEEKIAAGLIATYHNETLENRKALYYYGASDHELRSLMAPYLLQWHVMCDAKARGYTSYDLFGIAPEGAENHPWAGVTDFKKKFGGTVVEYEKSYQKITDWKWYLVYRIVKFLL